ncbi:MAG: DUF4349 domain-containing protein [Methanocalculus sp. MSAO_Arc2]|nr:MAG: DUF4349 domain-containing protein [Methanocalculus sp. MSAO_Arc2]
MDVVKRYGILLFLLLFVLSASSGCLMADPSLPGHVRSEGVVYEHMSAHEVTVPLTDRQVIKEGSIHLQTRDTRQTAEKITDISGRYNGRVQSLSLSSGGFRDGREQFSAEIIIRVPSHAFENAMHEIESLGTLRQRQVKTRDVTAEHTDLHAEKRALEQQIKRLSDILQKAETVEDILKVQSAIDAAQMNLDRTTGKIKLMESQIDEATITVSVREGEPIGIDSGFSLASVLNTAIHALLYVIGAIIIIAFALLPLAIIGGVAWLIIRRRNR